MKYILFIVVITLLGALVGSALGDSLFFALVGFILSGLIVGEIHIYQIDSILKVENF